MRKGLHLTEVEDEGIRGIGKFDKFELANAEVGGGASLQEQHQGIRIS